MLVLRIKSGNEVMVSHRTGESCFLRVKCSRPRYGMPTEVTVDAIQENDAFTLEPTDKGTDVARYILTHNLTREKVPIRIGAENFYGGHMNSANVAFDDDARNFLFDRPEVWKKKYLRLVSGVTA
jgi:hypothetical protein